MKKALYILIMLAAVVAIILDAQNIDAYKIFVGLTSSLILSVGILFGSKENPKYIKFISLGVAFCALADFIPFFTNNFVWEVSAYIVAKTLFAEAFRSYGSLKFNNKLIAILAVAGLSVFFYLSSALGEFLVPLGLYLGMMIYMTWMGIALHKSGVLKSSKWVFYSVLLWFACEILSGLDRFESNSILLGISVHASYWAALACLVISSILDPSAVKIENEKSTGFSHAMG